jgi:transposase
MYAELVFDQRVETWLRCHQHAFESWGGVPARIVPDYVPRNIIGLLCPTGLCGGHERDAPS